MPFDRQEPGGEGQGQEAGEEAEYVLLGLHRDGFTFQI
jgi:hypothetical protein